MYSPGFELSDSNRPYRGINACYDLNQRIETTRRLAEDQAGESMPTTADGIGLALRRAALEMAGAAVYFYQRAGADNEERRDRIWEVIYPTLPEYAVMRTHGPLRDQIGRVFGAAREEVLGGVTTKEAEKTEGSATNSTALQFADMALRAARSGVRSPHNRGPAAGAKPSFTSSQRSGAVPPRPTTAERLTRLEALAEKHRTRIVPGSEGVLGKLQPATADEYSADYQVYKIDPADRMLKLVGRDDPQHDPSTQILLRAANFAKQKEMSGRDAGNPVADMLVQIPQADRTQIFGYAVYNTLSGKDDTRLAPNCIFFRYDSGQDYRYYEEFLEDLHQEPDLVRAMLRGTDLVSQLRHATYNGSPWQVGIQPASQMFHVILPRFLTDVYGDGGMSEVLTIYGDHGGGIVRRLIRAAVAEPEERVSTPIHYKGRDGGGLVQRMQHDGSRRPVTVEGRLMQLSNKSSFLA